MICGDCWWLGVSRRVSACERVAVRAGVRACERVCVCVCVLAMDPLSRLL